MRVGISLLTLSPGISGGSETYARGLAGALGEIGELEYVAFVPARASDAGGPLPRIEVREPVGTGRGPSRIVGMAIAARRSRALHSALATADVLHYALTVPLPSTRLPTVVTLHDLQHHDLPTLFDPARRAFRRLAYDRAARCAHAVVVPSAFVRTRALELLELEPDRVHVAPFAVDHAMFRPEDEDREPLLLYPARAWPHKNHPRLLEAFALLRRRKPELRLVLTGQGLEALEPLPAGVERRGVLPLADLAGLYRRAACLVYPSLYEGFGLPPLEAMACGCPVAASNVAAIPEVCEGAAVLFDPADPESIAAGVEEALSRAAELRERGLERAARATWAETARLHERAYRAAAEAGTPHPSARR